MINKAIFEEASLFSENECQRLLRKRIDNSTIDGVLTDYLVYFEEAEECEIWKSEFKLLEQRLSSFIERYSKGLLDLLPLESISISHIGFLNDEFGEFTELHYDWEMVKVKDRDIIVKPFVILIYLTEIEEGGELLFPIQGVEISPELGKAVVFPCNYSYPHSSMPVIKGSKHVCRVTMKMNPKSYEVDSLEI
jgi:hypothetical protein